MATSTQYDAVRYDLATDSATMGDSEIETLYVRAADYWPGNRFAIEAQVRLFALQRLWAFAVKRVDYTANQSSEKLSQLRDGFKELYTLYNNDLKVATESTGSLVRMAQLRRASPRTVEVPWDYVFPDDFGVGMNRLDRDPFTFGVDDD